MQILLGREVTDSTSPIEGISSGMQNILFSDKRQRQIEVENFRHCFSFQSSYTEHVRASSAWEVEHYLLQMHL